MFFPSLSSGLFSALSKECGMLSAIILPSVVSAALGKQLCCRVPDGMRSSNILALGKSAVSSSGHYQKKILDGLILSLFNIKKF